jgi:C-terminal processing protease CtpA/Prc
MTAAPGGTVTDTPFYAESISGVQSVMDVVAGLCRATVVGERTPGAADHVTDIRLAATVTGELPVGYCTDSVTGTNWEGSGVAPQVDCAADDAIDAALARMPALKRR